MDQYRKDYAILDLPRLERQNQKNGPLKTHSQMFIITRRRLF